MLEGLARHAVEQVQLACDFDAREREGTKHEANGERRHLIKCQQATADGEQ